jgi:hypothetical protein
VRAYGIGTCDKWAHRVVMARVWDPMCSRIPHRPNGQNSADQPRLNFWKSGGLLILKPDLRAIDRIIRIAEPPAPGTQHFEQFLAGRSLLVRQWSNQLPTLPRNRSPKPRTPPPPWPRLPRVRTHRRQQRRLRHHRSLSILWSLMPTQSSGTTQPCRHCSAKQKNCTPSPPSSQRVRIPRRHLVRYPADSCPVRDEAARSRFQTTWSPFLKLRNPRPESILFVTNFARRTGDLQVLSKPDIHLLALTYDLEVERNGGDWRLRNEPNQKRVNGKPPGRAEAEAGAPGEAEKGEEAESSSPVATSEAAEKQEDTVLESSEETAPSSEGVTADSLAAQVQGLDVDDSAAQDTHIEVEDGEASAEDDDDGDGEWISPSTGPLLPSAALANYPFRSAEQHQKVPGAPECAH